MKGSVGHLDAAAGVTSLIKSVLALRNGVIPPSSHMRGPNPELQLDSGPFFVNGEPLTWTGTRRAGVSSFGIGGTNVHVVLEEALTHENRAKGPPPVTCLPLSSRTPRATAHMAHALADRMEKDPGIDRGDLIHTLVDRRAKLPCRVSVTGRDTAHLVSALRSVTEQDVSTVPETTPRLAFLFPGQGSQYVGMARDLYRKEPLFASEMDRCAELFTEHLGTDLRTVLFPESERESVCVERLRRTELTQPALFLVEYALACLWESWGVTPDVLAGHSVGEYVAACRAGVFSLEDAVALVSARGRLIQATPEGAMLSVLLPEGEVREWLTGAVEVAAVNAPGTCTVSGPTSEIDSLQKRLVEANVLCRRLRTSHAFHSPAMDEVIAPFTDVVRSVSLHAPRTPFFSGVTGTRITDRQATDPEYWGEHLRRPVLFSRITEALLSDPATILVEVGPGDTLTELARGHHAWDRTHTALTSLPRPEQGDDHVHVLGTLGRVWAAGVPVHRSALVPPGTHRALHLPAHPLTGELHWVDGTQGTDTVSVAESVPSGEVRAHVPGWQSLSPRVGDDGTGETSAWLVLGDAPLVRELAFGSDVSGAPVTRVSPEEALRPSPEYFSELLAGLPADRPGPIRVVHALTLDRESADPLTPERVEQTRSLGFDSLTALAEALQGSAPGRAVHIDVLCQGVYSVTGEETLRPEHTLLTGPSTVIPQEITDVTCRTLDITGTDPWAPSPKAVESVRSVLTGGSEEKELALRGTRWWRRSFTELDTHEGVDRLRDGGVYLITGGLGGIGLALAEHITETVSRPVLALVSRSELPEEDSWPRLMEERSSLGERLRRLVRMRESGARVLVFAGDVTDTERMSAVVHELRDAYGSLDGVVHAAGVPASGLLSHATDRDTEAVLAPKVTGTLVLDRVCAGMDLDFFLLCSSMTALLGGPGQNDYTAANAFLDGFAHWRRAIDGVPVTAVGWDTWSGVGMAARMPSVSEAPPEGQATDHPLLRVVEESRDSSTYVCTFDTEHSWIVDDHRLMGHGLVPGTAYLELVRAALAERVGGGVLELRDVLFLNPLIVPDGRPRSVFLTVEGTDEKARFTARSRDGDGQWQEHVLGTAHVVDRTEDDARELDELRARCAPAEVLDTPEGIRERMGADRFAPGRGPLEFHFGPRWQLLTDMHVGERHLFATLRLDEAFRDDLRSYPLHPALLDMAGGIFRVHAPDPYYLPLSYRRLRILRPLTATIHCFVGVVEDSDPSGETLVCDIELLDPEGRVLAVVEGFSVKRINDVDALTAQIEEMAAVTHDSAPSLPGPLAALAQGMDERAGKEAFARLMRTETLPEHVLVCLDAPERLRALARSITPGTLAESLEGLPAPGGTQPRPELDTPFVAPSSPEEQAVAKVWSEVLGVEKVGVHDDFFALGGHSLAAVRVNSGLRDLLGTEIALNDFFSEPTVAHTVALLASTPSKDKDVPITALPRKAQPEEDVDTLSDEEVDAMLRRMLDEEGGGEAR